MGFKTWQSRLSVKFAQYFTQYFRNIAQKIFRLFHIYRKRLASRTLSTFIPRAIIWKRQKSIVPTYSRIKNVYPWGAMCLHKNENSHSI